MNRGVAVLAFLMGFVLGGLVFAPAPHAGVDCEHRGGQHIDRHGGKLEDDRFHIARGERPTCDGDKDPEDREPAEKHPEEPHEVHLPSRHGDDTDDHGDHHVPGHQNHKWWRND